MPDPLLVGADVGTTSCKVAVCTLDGREVAHGRAPLAWRSTTFGTEVDAERVLDAVRTALGEALDRVPEAPVAGLGVASMAETGVLLGPDSSPVAPLIAWHDTRDRAQADRLAVELGAAEFSAATGLPIGTQWSLTKHRWRFDTGAVPDHAVKRLSVAEWVVHALGGEQAAEPSLASRTGWLDVRDRSWWAPTLEWSGLDPALLPPLAPAGTPLGRASAEMAGERLAGAVLTIAGHDHLAAAVGAGATADGDVLDSCGTAEALVRTVPAPLPASSVPTLTEHGVTVGLHVLPDRLSVLGATRGGLLLQHVLALLGRDDDLAGLDEAALRAEPGPVGVRLAPDGTATVSGVGRGTTPATVWRAALESVTAEAADMQRLVSTVAGDTGRVVMTGGWAHSAAMVALRRRAFGDAHRAPVTEAGARGAALLAGYAAGRYDDPFALPAPGRAPDTTGEER